jgi:hypothetical protein
MTKELEILKNITPTGESPHVTKSIKELGKEKLKELIKEETRTVKGIFQCFETPGASVKITCRKYPGVQPFEKTMTDGETYEVPLYVARHLNGTDASAGAILPNELRNTNIGSCSYPVHGFKWSGPQAPQSVMGDVPGHASGIPVPMVGIAKRVKRFGFQSLEFAGAA